MRRRRAADLEQRTQATLAAASERSSQHLCRLAELWRRQIVDWRREIGVIENVEKIGFEIRSEMFNVLNRVNLNNPISDLSSGLFGLSTSQKSPSAAQFGLRIAF